MRIETTTLMPALTEPTFLQTVEFAVIVDGQIMGRATLYVNTRAPFDTQTDIRTRTVIVGVVE